MNEYEQLIARGGLSLERLVTLCKVVDEGGLTRAAAGDISRLSLYSRQIKDLEVFFGIPLVRKVGRVAVPTDNAREIAGTARAHLKALQSHVGAEVQLGPFTIGSSQSLQEWFLAPRLAALREVIGMKRPLRLLVMRSREIAGALEDHRLDMGLVREDALPTGISTRFLMKLDYALFVPKAMAGGLTARKALQSLPLAIPMGGQLREHVDRAATQAKMSLNIALECTSFTLCADVVRRGLYAAILPSIAEANLDTQGVVKMTSPFRVEPSRRIVATWHRSTNDKLMLAVVRCLNRMSLN